MTFLNSMWDFSLSLGIAQEIKIFMHRAPGKKVSDPHRIGFNSWFVCV